MGNSKRQLFPTSHAWLIALSRFYCNTLYCLQPLCYMFPVIIWLLYCCIPIPSMIYLQTE